ncbi:MAG: FGGY family carbohydrate kinase [Deltaproteobacteria bacterium]
MFLGLDIGTSGVKATVMDDRGGVVAEARRDLVTSVPFAGGAEQAPADWWDAVVAAVSDLPDRDQVQAIGVTGQMHGAVLLDHAGEVLAPVILWNDTRAGREALVLDRADLRAVAGVQAMAKFPAAKLAWLRTHQPDVVARISTILMPKDWLGFCLHGALVTDPSDAAGTWWFDQKAGDWSGELLAASGAKPGWMPKVKAADAVAGHLLSDPATALGLRKGIPIAVGAGDTVAAMIAMGVVAPERAFLGISTSGQVVKVTSSYVPAPSLHAFSHGFPGLWYQMAALQSGAAPLLALATQRGCSVADLLAKADTTTQDLIADIAETYTVAARQMGGVVTPLAVGGGAQSDLLLQALADALGTAVLRPAGAQVGASLGAAKLAALACGAMSRQDLAQEPVISARFEPKTA